MGRPRVRAPRPQCTLFGAVGTHTTAALVRGRFGAPPGAPSIGGGRVQPPLPAAVAATEPSGFWTPGRRRGAPPARAPRGGRVRCPPRKRRARARALAQPPSGAPLRQMGGRCGHVRGWVASAPPSPAASCAGRVVLGVCPSPRGGGGTDGACIATRCRWGGAATRRRDTPRRVRLPARPRSRGRCVARPVRLWAVRVAVGWLAGILFLVSRAGAVRPWCQPRGWHHGRTAEVGVGCWCLP